MRVKLSNLAADCMKNDPRVKRQDNWVGRVAYLSAIEKYQTLQGFLDRAEKWRITKTGAVMSSQGGAYINYEEDQGFQYIDCETAEDMLEVLEVVTGYVSGDAVLGLNHSKDILDGLSYEWEIDAWDDDMP